MELNTISSIASLQAPVFVALFVIFLYLVNVYLIIYILDLCSPIPIITYVEITRHIKELADRCFMSRIGMVSGLASPHTIVDLSTSPSSRQSSDWNHSNTSPNHIFSAGFHGQLLPGGTPPLSFGGNNPSYSSPLTPTLTSSRIMQLASPPVPPTTQRRLSLVTGVGLDSTNGISERVPSSRVQSLDSNLPGFESRRRTTNNNGVNDSSSTPMVTLDAVAAATRFLSNTSMASFSMFVSHPPADGRGFTSSDRTGASSTARNAQEAIARNRMLAAQAVRDDEELNASTRTAVIVSAAGRRKSTRTRNHKRTARSPSSVQSASTDAAVASERRTADPVMIASGGRRYPTSANRSNGEFFPREIHTLTSGEMVGLTPAAATINSALEVSLTELSRPTKKQRITKSSSLKKPPPSNLDFNGLIEDVDKEPCAICMCEPTWEEDAQIDGCNHRFCFGCISKWSDRENSCPLCKSRFNKVTRVNKQRRTKNGPSVSNTKKVKQRDQRSDIVTGAALEGLLASIAANNGMASSLQGHIMVQRFGGALVPLLQRQQQNRNNSANRDFPNVFASDTSSDDDDAISSFMNLLGVRPSHGSRRQAQANHPFPSNTNVPPSSSTFALSFPTTSAGAPPSGTGTVPIANSGNHAHASRYSTRVAHASRYNTRVSFDATSNGTASNTFHHNYNLRSYASNAHDPSAGHASSNPLEIDDSDNSVVEVVHVDL